MKTKELFLSRQSSIGNSPRIVTIKKQQVMKTKLSVLLLYLCSLTLFAACSNNRQKQKTPAENVATPIRNFLKQKYPAATILKSEKETNGTEVIYKKRVCTKKYGSTRRSNGSPHIGKSVPATFLSPLWMRCKAPPTTNIK